ncbi:unnamed protein product [Sphenostylis stenocarpa]|uniref:NADH:quinone oxidoreductase/Mrp antiporter transmembrane domain-containing protein n=1 Tax=Sphenostylis stenocarpa TaxID=92480 RepID=A0AA86VQY3_9FABA|nr:unnamed protein product [Sphenostylis stenocarpa]
MFTTTSLHARGARLIHIIACQSSSAVRKFAHIGSHTWSPDAMEGPTLVSALIHAATMVTTGVFMIARCSPLFEYPPTTLIIITSAGAMTSFLATTTGILQNDLKRVIAYSTYSSVIHAMSDEQDMRKMRGLPPHVILELAYTKYTISGNFAFRFGKCFCETSYDVMMRPFFNTSGSREYICRILGQSVTHPLRVKKKGRRKEALERAKSICSNFWPCTDHLMDHGLNGHCLKGLCPMDRRPPPNKVRLAPMGHSNYPRRHSKLEG